MNKKKLTKVLLILFLVIALTGCTKVLTDKNKKAVKNPITGQSLTENIVCKPTNKKTIKLYEDNGKNLEKLPECKDLKIKGKYEGLWNTFFIRPLSYAIVKLGTIFKSAALALITITIIIRLVLYPITRKTAMQSENIKKAQPEIKKIEKKYEGKTDSESTTKKGQEMMLVYKKYNINPMSGCIFAIIQMPLLFAFIEAINRVPAIFEETFLGLNMGMTPWVGITGGKIYYIIIPALIVLVTYFSFKMNSASTAADSGKQSKMMATFMTIFIGFMSFTLSTAIGIYWIVSSGFTVVQNIITDRSRRNGKNNS